MFRKIEVGAGAKGMKNMATKYKKARKGGCGCRGK